MSHALDFLENIVIYTNMCVCVCVCVYIYIYIYIYTVSLRFLWMFGKKKLLNKKRQSNNTECAHTFFVNNICVLDMSCTPVVTQVGCG